MPKSSVKQILPVSGSWFRVLGTKDSPVLERVVFWALLKTEDTEVIVGVPREEILEISDGTYLSDERLAKMESFGAANLEGWLSYLERTSAVFFSWPLDLDLAMLTAFPAAYAATIEGTGPRMTNESAAEVVLGTAGPGLTSYTGNAQGFQDQMAAYRYHFLTHSKPATHLRALTHIDLPALKAGMPAPLKRVVQHIAAHLSGL